MNDTTFQGDGKVAYVPVVVNNKPPKQSNYDRLISKSPEELAEWLTNFSSSNVKPYATARVEMYRGRLLDWLKEEDDNGRDT